MFALHVYTPGLLGGSMAALRFCALASGGDALDRLVTAFTDMVYRQVRLICVLLSGPNWAQGWGSLMSATA